MLLERLSEYATSYLELPPPGYQWQSIRYIIELDQTGRMLGRPIDTADPSSRETKRGTQRLAPHAKRASGIRPKLLADRGDYALGVIPPDGKPDRVRQMHEAFVELTRACAAATHLAEVEAVVFFLDGWDIETLDLGADFDPAAQLTFRVGGVFPMDLPLVQDFWASRQAPDDDAGEHLSCIVCGTVGPVLERHPLKIKGIPGGQMSGTDLISANSKAYESYGLSYSQIAPTCPRCAERYLNALNDLLADDEHHLRVGSLVYVFWSRKPTRISFGPLLANPSEAEVKRLYEAVRRAEKDAVELDPTAFYVLALGASAARAVVRDWIDTTVGEAQRRLARYFRLQALVEWDGTPGEPVAIWRLAGATVRDPRKETIPPTVIDALLNLAFAARNDNVGALLEYAVQRNRAEQKVTRERAILIKMALLAREGDVSTLVQLNPDHPDVAYHCGRLLALLDAIQQRALGNPNATITDKFYGTASSAPAAVFGTLLHGVQAHLGKLRKDQPGMYGLFTEDLEEIMGRIAVFPLTLTLPQQGLFALGFWHQRAAARLERSERFAAKAAAQDDSGAVATSGKDRDA